MNTNIWLLGAVLFAVLGLHAAIAANGTWYLILSAGIHLAASAVFTRNAIVTHRTPELDT